MKILIVTQYFWPENFRVNDLASALSENGHSVTVLSGIPNYPSGEIYPEFANYPQAFTSFRGAEIIRVPMAARGTGNLRLALNYVSFALAASTVGAWKLRGRQYDAIIGIALSPVTAVIPAIVQKRVKGAPLAVWVFDLWPESLVAVGITSNKFALGVIGKLVSWIYRSADLILAQSESFLDHVHKYAPSARAEYLPSWSEEIFTEAASATQPLGHGFNIVFAGNVGEAQDFPAVLSAMQALPPEANIRLWIAGDGRAAKWVEQEVVSRNIQDRVHMLARRPIDEMPGLFASADALLVTLRDDPNLSKTIPGKIQSYLAAGRPVLGMLGGEGKKVLVEARAGLVAHAGDGLSLASNMLSLASMTGTERENMGRNGRAYYERNFTRTAVMGRLELLLKEIADI